MYSHFSAPLLWHLAANASYPFLTKPSTSLPTESLISGSCLLSGYLITTPSSSPSLSKKAVEDSFRLCRSEVGSWGTANRWEWEWDADMRREVSDWNSETNWLHQKKRINIPCDTGNDKRLTFGHLALPCLARLLHLDPWYPNLTG